MLSCSPDVSTAIAPPPNRPPKGHNPPEPMQTDSNRLTTSERQRRLSQHLCSGASGHMILACPLRPPRSLVSAIQPSIQRMNPLSTCAQLTVSKTVISVSALLDSGSAVRGPSPVPSPTCSKARPSPCPGTPLPPKHLTPSRRLSPAHRSFVHPNPELPFVVEVDASTTGVGVVLSHQQGTPPRLHPCAFFSRKLSPAEKHYDIGNRELLAIKLALEEWRHWLEGAAQPFLVLTDHKNLQYLRDAKWLNPRQARWALFFTRFPFKISYRPDPINIKADALSRNQCARR